MKRRRISRRRTGKRRKKRRSGPLTKGLTTRKEKKGLAQCQRPEDKGSKLQGSRGSSGQCLQKSFQLREFRKKEEIAKAAKKEEAKKEVEEEEKSQAALSPDFGRDSSSSSSHDSLDKREKKKP